MRTAYLGSSEFAAAVLRRLAASPHRPSLVVTPPDRRRGRGRRPAPPPAAAAAAELGLEVVQCEDVNAEPVRRRIAAAEAQALLVCAFGQIVREPLLSGWTILNVHPSLLPRWRGAAPIERAIMAGDRSTGVCVMRLVEALDAGPVALREEVPIGAGDDYATLAALLAERGGELAVEAFDLAEAGALRFVEQDEAGATYAEKIAAAERRLDPGLAATRLEAQVRALTPHIGAYLELAGGERLGVRRARAVDAGPPAAELRAEGGELLLGCGSGALRLELVQAPGGRPMPAADYLRGHPLPSP